MRSKEESMSRHTPSHRRFVALALTLAPVVAAAGCSEDRLPAQDAAAGDAVTLADATSIDASGPIPACPDTTGPIDPTLLIDDFEHAGGAMPMIAGRTGTWWASGDATPNAIMQPFGEAAPDLIPGGRCGSHRALHVTGSGFLDWGSTINVAMHTGPNASGVYEEQPYDARARGYQGIRFFARIGGTSVATVRFAVSDQYARPEAGLCAPAGTQGNGCYDTFGVLLTSALTTEWREFQIPWTGLAQRNFGLQGGVAPDTSKLYDIGFTFPGKVVFDLWVDDVRFY
jgi:hypothetical protein